MLDSRIHVYKKSILNSIYKINSSGILVYQDTSIVSSATHAAFEISANQLGRFPVIITRGSCSWRLALAVNLELRNSMYGSTGFTGHGTYNNKIQQ